MPSQTQLQDGKELTLGALFLLDNAPECPRGMSWHEFSGWAIAKHLKRYAHYYHPQGQRSLATVARMRVRILDMWKNNTKKKMPEPDEECKDGVDILFAYGGTKLLQKRFLEDQKYDKDTFSESQLNKHVSEKSASGKAKIDGRPEGQTAEGSNGSRNANNHDVREQEHRAGGANATAPNSTQPILPSPPSNVGTSLLPPDNGHTAPNSNSVDIQERREQSETASGEQPQPSHAEGRRLRSSVSSQTRPLIADNGTLYASKEVSAAFSGNNPGGHNESVPGPKRKLTEDHGLQKRQRQLDNATNQDDSNGREPPSNVTTQAGHSSKVPLTVNETKGLEVPQNAVTSRENQHQPQLAKLYLNQQERNMKSMYSDIKEATAVVVSSIGDIRNTQSPLQPKPSSPLKDLYARCWGPQWKEVRVRQIRDCVLTTPQVTASLLSAFLYDKVLTQEARLQEIVSNVVEMGGSLGEALLEELDISIRGKEIANRARMIEAQKACSKLSQDHDVLQQQLKLEAESLSRDASTIISPHLDALSSYAKLLGLSSNHSETETLHVFESEFVEVIQKTLHYRLQLLATGCEYAFTWPNPDDVFDSRTMQIQGGRSENTADQSIVLFTVFPGLEIKPMSSDELESLPDAKAMVKVQRSEDRL